MANVMPMPTSATLLQLQSTNTPPADVTLMIADVKQFRLLNRHFPQRTGVFCLGFKALSNDFFTSLQPNMVVSPAISTQFDCIDVARLLDQASYTGSFRVVCGDLPNPEMIRREVSRHFPLLDFDIIVENTMEA